MSEERDFDVHYSGAMRRLQGVTSKAAIADTLAQVLRQADSLRAQNERLRAALNEAQRLLSVCSFDAPEDLVGLEMIDAALSTKD